MTCRKAESLSVRSHCNALSDRQRAALELHLEACGACRARLEGLRSGMSLLAQIEELPSPTGLAHRALEHYPARNLERQPVYAGVFGVRLAVAALAGMALVGTAVLHAVRRPEVELVQGSSPRRSAPHPSGVEVFRASPGPAAGAAKAAARPPKTARFRQPAPGEAAPGKRGRPAGGRHSVQMSEPEKPVVDDLQYLDGYAPALASRWLGGDDERREIRELLARQLSRIAVKDDFVEIPYPRIADAARQSETMEAAVRQYDREAQVVDARLFRKVTLRLRQTPLSDFCRVLQQQTGVTFAASRTVGDENVTVFVKDMAARDVMRAVARLFDYKWGRSGEESAYRYELRQDLRAQIAEEELRSRQVNQMLLALDEQIAGYLPYLDLSPEQIQSRLEGAQGAEKYRLKDLAEWKWGPIQLYHRLSAAQRQILAGGGHLQFRTDARSPELRLPGEWRSLLLPRLNLVLGTIGGQPWIASPIFFNGRPTSPLAGQPGAEVGVSLELKGRQEGCLSLAAYVTAYLLKGDGAEAALPGSRGGGLGSAQSPPDAKANNAKLNAKLRETAPYRRTVTIEPKVTCPWFALEGREKENNGFRVELDGGRRKYYVDLEGQLREGEEPPHLTTSEVWEAIHDATGMPVVADAYSRLHDARKLKARQESQFDALCRLGDEMGVRWQQDGAFLMGRTVTYLWDKIKEVPARHLRRWREAREKHGFLPLEDLLEASTLSDRQLDAHTMGHVIGHCWGLEDWIIVGEGATVPIGLTGPRGSRPYARFLALLSPGQRARALRQGLTFEELVPAQQEALLQLLVRDRRTPRDAVGVRFRVDYAPAGSYVWNPSVATRAEADQLERTAPFVWGKTAEATLAAARRAYPHAQSSQVVRSRGILAFTFTNPHTGASWKAGWIGVSISNRE